MVKILAFTDDAESRDRFQFLYTGLCQSSKTQAQREVRTLKTEGAVRRKFEAVGKLADEEATPTRFEFAQRVPAGPCVIELEAEEIKLLLDYMPAVAWSPMVAELVADAVEWASMAPEKKVYERSRLAAV